MRFVSISLESYSEHEVIAFILEFFESVCRHGDKYNCESMALGPSSGYGSIALVFTSDLHQHRSKSQTGSSIKYKKSNFK